MRRAALSLSLAAAAAGCGRGRPRDGEPPPVTRAGDPVAPAPRDAAPAPVHGFVTGQVVIAARVDGQVRPVRLDPARARWEPLGSGDAHLFPTEVGFDDAVLAIAARGEHDGDHVEQLAWVRGARVTPFGPRAGSIRNPSHAGGALVLESSAASFRDLYRVDAGDRAVRLTDDAAGNFEPALSPDGATIVFTSSRDGDAELYSMPTSGGRATRLTASARDDWGARWSPDGRRLVFLSDREGSPRSFVMDADGTDLRRLTAEPDRAIVEDAPRWSPDGRIVALVQARGERGAVVLVAVDGDDGAAPTITPAAADDRDPTWSPDGAYLALARRTPPAGPRVVFVRVPDGVVMAAEDGPEPLALRWYAAAPPPPGPRPTAAPGSRGAAAPGRSP
jgi:dipeptidyl aminopeptidase/acylaminoacyl peptidase